MGYRLERFTFARPNTPVCPIRSHGLATSKVLQILKQQCLK